MPILETWKTRTRVSRSTTSALVHFGIAIIIVTVSVTLIMEELELPKHALFQALGIFGALSGILFFGKRKPILTRSFGAANRITLVRACMTSILASLIGSATQLTEKEIWILVLFAAVVLVLDGLDGWVARYFHTGSTFGAAFDLEVDALFILILAVITWELNKVGSWVLLIGVMRYLFVVAGWVIPALQQPLPSNQRRRVICLIQAGVLLFALCPVISPATASLFAMLALTLLVISFSQDIYYLVCNTSSPGDTP